LRVVIFLRAEGWGARQLAVSLSLTAAAFGDEVHLALFGEPLRLFLADRFDEGAPPEAAPSRVGSLSVELGEGRGELGIRVVACDTALRLIGADPARASPPLDAVTSLPSLWRLAQDGRALTV